MHWNQIEDRWEKLKGNIQQQWAKFADDDLEDGSGDVSNNSGGPGDGVGMPGNGESDQIDDSGKQNLNPMPDGLDVPAHAKDEPPPIKKKD